MKRKYYLDIICFSAGLLTVLTYVASLSFIWIEIDVASSVRYSIFYLSRIFCLLSIISGVVALILNKKKKMKYQTSLIKQGLIMGLSLVVLELLYALYTLIEILIFYRHRTMPYLEV